MHDLWYEADSKVLSLETIGMARTDCTFVLKTHEI